MLFFLAIVTVFMQFYLIALLMGDHGLTFDTDHAYLKAHPDAFVMNKVDTTGIFAAMMIAMAIVLLIIAYDIHEHSTVAISLFVSSEIMRNSGMWFSFILHFMLLIMQVQFSLLMGKYSFYVIFVKTDLQSIFMNCTALLFLNEIDNIVCKVFKIFLFKQDQELFVLGVHYVGDNGETSPVNVLT